jgi:molecular chaperone DnaK
MYKAQQEAEGGAAPEGAPADEAPADDGVVDADFEEVDPDKKRQVSLIRVTCFQDTPQMT